MAYKIFYNPLKQDVIMGYSDGETSLQFPYIEVEDVAPFENMKLERDEKNLPQLKIQGYHEEVIADVAADIPAEVITEIITNE